ncbi:LlaJI family restriction endonuclease [Chryseobacterium gallinarum]|uniref:LlaJI family restriction endonuclease n=1 Tax=Chryseobacterium gallinarum TaxID=1324352 RepID=A0ABX6KL83_CHRGL|nr:LlaJI family restriction endonuclease [Chryseobacterium gallinarum]QIY89407.1 LlaJI family restriction endonuclease [Chryseobacterium gallinarum]
MIILFEEYHYKTEDLSKVLTERYYYPINGIESKINFVGYYFNPHINDGKGDVIIIFPKVFINKHNLAFDEFTPESLINPTPEINNRLIVAGKDKVIFEISTWLYQAIQQFNKRHFYNSISENQFINQVVTNLDDNSNTELDIILSLLRFHKDNQDLFTFIAKTAHSQQNKINWQNTINKKQPIIQNNRPIYINIATTRKRINDDEELLILLYSTLNHIKEKYAFNFQVPQNYNIIKGHQFDMILRRGCRLLKNIKYKYFSDKMICLYNLLFTYFERSEKTQSKKQIEEILLIRDFNIVFEDMIDDLIGDSNLFSELKNHADGKQVDHIYKYKSLLIEDEIYFVGDSKYYKHQNSVGKNSKAKQFTYAKNIIQYNINLFNNGILDPRIRYRENETEGYNITPNFFISAFVNKDFDFSKSYLKEIGKPIIQFHFENRLFDRDTLFVQSYNINFLFVLSAYLSRNSTLKSNFKKDTQKLFREKLIAFINEKYQFYKVKPIEEDFIYKHFKLLNGKIYKPSFLGKELIIAFEKKYDTENESIMKKISAELNENAAYKLY